MGNHSRRQGSGGFLGGLRELFGGGSQRQSTPAEGHTSQPQRTTAPEESTPILDAATEEVAGPSAPEALKVYPGYEEDWHQSQDDLIRQVTEDFNREKGWGKDHPDYLSPDLVKAWALQESGGHKEIFTGGDMMQMNNTGDWAKEKEWFGVKKREKLDPRKSLATALRWAYYKGEITRAAKDDGDASWHDTQRGTQSVPGYQSKFTDWSTALDNYNGGGVRNYNGEIQARHRSGTRPTSAVS
jgi:hypothetical protein